MAASADLTTLESVKNYLSLTDDQTGRDALLSSIIAAVSESIESYCRREFARKVRTEFYDGACTNALLLACRPVHSVVAVHDDLDRNFNDLSKLAEDSYVVYENEGLIRLRYSLFAPGIKNVRVEYEAGYEVIPAVVAQAANILVAHYYTRARSGADAIASESVGVYSVSYDTGEWPQRAVGLLAEFREVQI